MQTRRPATHYSSARQTKKDAYADLDEMTGHYNPLFEELEATGIVFPSSDSVSSSPVNSAPASTSPTHPPPPVPHQQILGLGLRFFPIGDLEYLCEIFGHQGCSAKYPCLRCLCPNNQLQDPDMEWDTTKTMDENIREAKGYMAWQAANSGKAPTPRELPYAQYPRMVRLPLFHYCLPERVSGAPLHQDIGTGNK